MRHFQTFTVLWQAFLKAPLVNGCCNKLNIDGNVFISLSTETEQEDASVQSEAQ